jgi:hypothetical protein
MCSCTECQQMAVQAAPRNRQLYQIVLSHAWTSVLVARQCSPTLVQTAKGSTGWTWVHGPPTSSLLSRFNLLIFRSLRQNEGAFKGQDIHRCKCPARGCPPVVSHYTKRLLPGGHHEASTTIKSMHRTAGRLRRPFLKLPHFRYVSLYFNQVSLNHFWMA